MSEQHGSKPRPSWDNVRRWLSGAEPGPEGSVRVLSREEMQERIATLRDAAIVEKERADAIEERRLRLELWLRWWVGMAVVGWTIVGYLLAEAIFRAGW